MKREKKNQNYCNLIERFYQCEPVPVPVPVPFVEWIPFMKAVKALSIGDFRKLLSHATYIGRLSYFSIHSIFPRISDNVAIKNYRYDFSPNAFIALYSVN